MISRALILLLALASWPAVARDRQALKEFAVTTAVGRVLAWEPWSNHWEVIRAGTKLPEGTLVQVGEDSSLAFEIAASQGFKGLRAESARVRINKPLVLRLDENVLRKVALNSYFISQFPDITVAPKSQKSKSMVSFEISEAWKRFAAILARDNKSHPLSSLSLNSPNDLPDADVAVRSKKIQIYTPPDGTTLISEKMPVPVTISWEKIPEPGAKYELSVWRTTDTRGDPLAVTTYDYYLAKLPAYGSYYVQVQAGEGRWQSGVHRIDVAAPLALASSEREPAAELPSLSLTLPPKNFLYVARAFPLVVTFHWEEDRGAQRKPQYEFVLADAKGKEIVRSKVDRQVVSVPFGRGGDFQWHVESLVAHGTEGEVERLSSATRSLHLKLARDLAAAPVIPPAAPPDPLIELLKPAGSRVVYLDTF